MQEKNKHLFKLVLIYLSRRPRTTKEILDWLEKREADSETKEELLKKLVDLKLLNDREYAAAFIRTRNLVKPRSKRVLRMELLQKGVSENDIEDALEEVPVDEVALAKRLAEKNAWKWRTLSDKERKQKTMEFLARKGFSWEVIKKIDINMGDEDRRPI